MTQMLHSQVLWEKMQAKSALVPAFNNLNDTLPVAYISHRFEDLYCRSDPKLLPSLFHTNASKLQAIALFQCFGKITTVFNLSVFKCRF